LVRGIRSGTCFANSFEVEQIENPVNQGNGAVKFFKSLFGRVVLALILGIIIGVATPDFARSLQPLGDGFVKLIQMIIAPLVFSVVATGICGSGDLKKVGRVGLKTIVYFEVITTFALAIGIMLANILHPGAGMNIDVHSLDATQMSAYAERAKNLHSVSEFLMNLIPTTVFDAFTKGDILQVLLFAVLFGVALSLAGEPGRYVSHGLEAIAHVLFKVIGLIIKLAPIGVFGAVAFTAGKYGVASLGKLALLVLVFYLSCAIFIVFVLGTILRIAGFSIFKFLRYLREELMIVLGTASSDAVLPAIMRKLEWMGIKDSTVGLVIPTGYSFNLDGFSIYLTLAVVFIAQATNTPLSFHDLALILLVSLITSKGAHGIPGSAIVILAATLKAIPAIPVVGLVLILPIDWFVGIGRALTNLTGNCVATVVIARWENDIDLGRAGAVLDGTAEEEFGYVPEKAPDSAPAG
jgi:aerobic C4-dicarboxylate transport protein